jgi:hypothetical protein
MPRFYALTILFLLSLYAANGQTKDIEHFRCAFFESYKSGNMAAWPALIEEMEQAKQTDLKWQLEILKSIYGLVGYQIGLGDKDLARKYIAKADGYLDKLLPKNEGNAQLHSLAGAFYGYKISFAAYKAPFLGPKSLDHINKALELDPKEPMGYMVKGYSLSYRPPVFGGNKNEALSCYRQASSLFEAQNDSKCNWQKMLLKAFILKTLYETHQEKEAEAFLAAMQKEYGALPWIRKFAGAQYSTGK